MVLDADAQKVLDAAKLTGAPPIETLSPEEARLAMKARREALKQVTPGMAEVRDLAAQGPHGPIPLRLYRAAAAAAVSPQPCLVFFHGGGWVFGDLDTHDNLCRLLSHAIGGTVIAVDYRLAPEHKFPAAYDDSLAATTWVAEYADALGIDRHRIAVCGDSAGGNLATTVALTAAEQGYPELIAQVLIYPTVDLGFAQESYRRVGEGYFLTTTGMEWFRGHYLRGDEDVADWRASPLRAGDLSKLPPAYVVTAGCDPLCDEGEEYAGAMKRAGVPVMFRHLPGQMHGFIGMSGYIAAADVTIAEIGRFLREVWAAT